MESRSPERVVNDNDTVIEPNTKPVSWLRIAKLTLLALTGVGALWLLGRIYTVGPGKVATVTDGRTGKMRLIGSGMHVLESPFAIFNGEVPNPRQSVIMRFNDLKVRTADGVEISTGVDLRYNIQNPIALATSVDGPYKNALREAISTSLSTIISSEGVTYGQLSSARAPQLLPNQQSSTEAPIITQREEKSSQRDMTLSSKSSSTSSAVSINNLGILLLNKMREFCDGWGILISVSQVVDPKATHPDVERRYEESARLINDELNAYRCAATVKDRMKIETQGKSERMILEANAEAQRMQVIALADQKCVEIATAAQVERLRKISETIATAPESGRQIMVLDTQVAIADKLAAGKNMVVTNPFNLYPATQPFSTSIPALERKTEASPVALNSR